MIDSFHSATAPIVQHSPVWLETTLQLFLNIGEIVKLSRFEHSQAGHSFLEACTDTTIDRWGENRLTIAAQSLFLKISLSFSADILCLIVILWTTSKLLTIFLAWALLYPFWALPYPSWAEKYRAQPVLFFSPFPESLSSNSQSTFSHARCSLTYWLSLFPIFTLLSFISLATLNISLSKIQLWPTRHAANHFATSNVCSVPPEKIKQN